MDFSMIMKVRNAWETFRTNHPKFPMFLDAVKRHGIKEGTIIAVTITTPEGENISTNLKVTSSDLELFETLKQIRP